MMQMPLYLFAKSCNAVLHPAALDRGIRFVSVPGVPGHFFEKYARVCILNFFLDTILIVTTFF